MKNITEPLATIMSMIGAALVSYPSLQLYGFLIWIPSNFLWIYFAISNKHKWMALLFLFYLCTASLGAWNNL